MKKFTPPSDRSETLDHPPEQQIQIHPRGIITACRVSMCMDYGWSMLESGLLILFWDISIDYWLYNKEYKQKKETTYIDNQAQTYWQSGT